MILVDLKPKCEVTEEFTSPFVTTQTQHRELLSGCVSQEVSGTSQEVHVINLRNGNDGAAGKVVAVQIQPLSSQG